MKLKTLSVLAGVSAPLIATASADAGFVGLELVLKIPNDFGITTINVYAEFDNMGNDMFLAAAGTPVTPLLIGVWDGTFWNGPSGGDTAPSSALIGVYPSLAFDSFYTVGLKVIPMGGSDDTTLVNLPTLGSSPTNSVTEVFSDSASWAGVPPPSPQGDPWHPTSGGGAGQVLIGQFSTINGLGFYGTFLLQYMGDGVVGPQEMVAFEWLYPTPGGLGLLGVAGLLRTRRRQRGCPRFGYGPRH
ncbi:MAG: hypothetical protein ACYTF4_03910 [Planctomycetota bacterium]